jgi:hypothetical protein
VKTFVLVAAVLLFNVVAFHLLHSDLRRSRALVAAQAERLVTLETRPVARLGYFGAGDTEQGLLPWGLTDMPPNGSWHVGETLLLVTDDGEQGGEE